MQPLPKLVWHFLLCLLKFAWFDSVNYIHYFHYEIFIILHLQWSLAFLFHYCFKHRILHVLHSGHILMTSLWRQWHHVSVIGPDKLWHVVLCHQLSSLSTHPVSSTVTWPWSTAQATCTVWVSVRDLNSSCTIGALGLPAWVAVIRWNWSAMWHNSFCFVLQTVRWRTVCTRHMSVA